MNQPKFENHATTTHYTLALLYSQAQEALKCINHGNLVNPVVNVYFLGTPQSISFPPLLAFNYFGEDRGSHICT